jgi:hypothetical protein
MSGNNFEQHRANGTNIPSPLSEVEISSIVAAGGGTKKVNPGLAEFALDDCGGTRATSRIRRGLPPTAFEISNVFSALVILERTTCIPPVFMSA